MKIKLVRPYAHHTKGEVLVAGKDIAYGAAEALCAASADGPPYARTLTETTDSEPDKDTDSGDTE